MDLNDISQEEFERIEAYLNGELSGEEAITFYNQLNTDNNFKSKFEDIKAVLTGIETQSLKEDLDIFHSDMSSTEDETVVHQPKVRTLNWKKLAVAAVLIISLGGFWFFNGNSNDRLYSEYFTPDPGLPTTMSSTENYEFYEAMVDYKQGNYKTAISKWESLLEAKPKNDTLQYFIGSALLADKNETVAIIHLDNVTTLANSTFRDDAYYYLGLAFLKKGDTKSAIEALKQSDLPKSKDLLKKLD